LAMVCVATGISICAGCIQLHLSCSMQINKQTEAHIRMQRRTHARNLFICMLHPQQKLAHKHRYQHTQTHTHTHESTHKCNYNNPRRITAEVKIIADPCDFRQDTFMHLLVKQYRNLYKILWIFGILLVFF